ncbi:RNase H domain-containing protein [Trichonephila clavipes]|nr:RNase H domain-containing protein [Trichonephila clavipes]
MAFQYTVAPAVSNLQKFEKVLLRAARIITGLRNTCPKDIVLFEVYLQPFSLRIQRRNPVGCSVFSSALIAFDEAFGALAFLPNGKEIWILFDSRSAIPHLYNWQSVRDNVVVSILTKIRRLSTLHQIHLQWIPSHVDLEGNEIADTLAKAGACEVPEPSEPSSTFLRFTLELNTRIRPLGLSPRAPLVSVFSLWKLSGSRF